MAKLKMPSGVFTEEQNGLRVRVINSMESQADAIPVFNRSLLLLEEALTSSPSIPDNPQVSDIIGFNGNLKAVVPAGFLLLHNDLLSLRGRGMASGASSESDSSGSLLSMMGNILALAGGAAVAVAIGKNLFAGSEESTISIQKVVDDLNKKLTADELYADPVVRAAQKLGFIAYLEVYFASQAAAMSVDNLAGRVADAALTFGTKILDGLYSRPVEKTYAKIQTLVDGVIELTTAKELLKSKAVTTAVNLGFAAYIITYFATQTASSTLDTAAAALGSAPATFTKTLLGSLFGDSTRSYDKIQSIINDIITLQTAKDLLDSPSVKKVVNDSFVSYIKYYFESQEKALGSDTFFESLGEAPTKLAKGLVGGLYNMVTGGDINTPQVLQSIINSINSEDFINDPTVQETVHNAAKEGIRSYIKVYYDSWADVISDQTQLESNNIVQKGASWLKGAANAVLGKNEVPDFVLRLKEVASGFSDEDMPSESQLRSLKKESILKGAEAVLETQLDIFKDQLEFSSDPYAYGENSNIFSKMFDANASLNINMSNEEITSATLEGVSILNKISSTLDLLSQAIANGTNGLSSPIIINNESSTSASDDLSFSIPG
jgi:hypothetical protein